MFKYIYIVCVCLVILCVSIFPIDYLHLHTLNIYNTDVELYPVSLLL